MLFAEHDPDTLCWHCSRFVRSLNDRATAREAADRGATKAISERQLHHRLHVLVTPFPYGGGGESECKLEPQIAVTPARLVWQVKIASTLPTGSALYGLSCLAKGSQSSPAHIFGPLLGTLRARAHRRIQLHFSFRRGHRHDIRNSCYEQVALSAAIISTQFGWVLLRSSDNPRTHLAWERMAKSGEPIPTP